MQIYLAHVFFHFYIILCTLLHPSRFPHLLLLICLQPTLLHKLHHLYVYIYQIHELYHSTIIQYKHRHHYVLIFHTHWHSSQTNILHKHYHLPKLIFLFHSFFHFSKYLNKYFYLIVNILAIQLLLYPQVQGEHIRISHSFLQLIYSFLYKNLEV